MSDENGLVKKEIKTDLTQEELERVNKYVEEGLPGISQITASQLAQMMDLYLSGKTYRFISSTLSIKLVKVMYMSHKFEWYEARQGYLADIDRNLKSRMAEAKIESQDFLLQLTQLWQKKIGNKIQLYLATGDEAHAEKIDLKEVDRYIKTMDILHRVEATPAAKSATVGLNVGDGVNIKKIGDNEVEITPRAKAIGDVLKHYADIRREEDRNKVTKEIKDVKTEPKGEEDNEK